MKRTAGRPLPLGVEFGKDQMNFSVEVPEEKTCRLLLYKKGDVLPCVSYEMSDSVGNVRFLGLSHPDDSEYEYLYEIDGEPYLDPYASVLIRHKTRVNGQKTAVWKPKSEHSEQIPSEQIQSEQIRGGLSQTQYDWEDDRPLQLPNYEVVAYALHVRGFTMDSSSRVKQRGTFQGVIEKIPYLQDLGINQIQCMPVYEFENSGIKTNYWGYGPGYYFAPKSSYASDGDGVNGLKDMVKACHKSGIEVVLEMPFTSETPKLMIVECLRYYVMEFHIDGFLLNPYHVPMDSLSQDPILAHTKLLRHGEDYQTVMRRFLKGDEDVISDVIYWLRHQTAAEGVYNTITTHTGFTLYDLVSYDGKHNEANGENNQDGPDFNFSWNCGAEGSSRKKSVTELRERQMRNAFFLLLLSQGTPCILAGDEFANSQKGNNNVYCQDNPIGWVNWNNRPKEQELHQFVRDLIHLRKNCRIFHPDHEYLGIDRTGCGVPDVSYHGEMAWRAPIEIASRWLGVYYGAVDADEKSFFVAYNMHWLEHTFALPSPGKDRKWYPIASTKEGVATASGYLDEQREIKVDARTIIVLEGK